MELGLRKLCIDNFESQLTDFKSKFSVFSGAKKYPMVVFADSFDEVPTKINFVTEFYDTLGNNPKNKIVICCRSEFIQRDSDYAKYFKPTHAEMGDYTKRFIAPLSEKNFNHKEYIKKYYAVFQDILSTNIKLEDVFAKIQEKNLNNLMTTGYMVYLTLQVLPQLMKVGDAEVITRRKIYLKYTRMKIEKVDEGTKNLFRETLKISDKVEFDKKKEFIRLNENIAMHLTTILHELGLTKIDNKNIHGKAFFEKYHFNPMDKCFDNHFLAGIFRALDLNVNVRGTIPNEVINIGFAHDSIKNYYITAIVMDEAGCIREYES